MVLTGKDLAEQDENKKKKRNLLFKNYFRDSTFKISFLSPMASKHTLSHCKEAVIHQKLSQSYSIGNCLPATQARVFLQSFMPSETGIQHTFIFTWYIQNLLRILQILSKCPEIKQGMLGSDSYQGDGLAFGSLHDFGLQGEQRQKHGSDLFILRLSPCWNAWN